VRAARARRADAPRQVRLGPVAFWIITGTLVILAVWTIITATYFAFREDVLAKLVARHAEMQFALKIASPSCAPRSTAFRAAS
jgi:hypothetical protein